MHIFLALMHDTSYVACMIFGGMYIEHQDVKKLHYALNNVYLSSKFHMVQANRSEDVWFYFKNRFLEYGIPHMSNRTNETISTSWLVVYTHQATD
jgi:hypothetical protein